MSSERVLPADTPIKVTWGSERFSPVSYQSVEVGPFEITLLSREGETARDVYDRAMPILDDLAAESYRSKVTGFLSRVRDAAQRARSRG